MLQNYLAAALRNMTRNRLYVAINVIGLAIGFSTTLLIALFVRAETTFDQFLPGHEHIYLLAERIDISGQPPIDTPTVQSTVAKALALNVPAVRKAARLIPSKHTLGHGEIETNERIYWADAEIFEVLPFPAAAGELQSALARPDGLVLTRRMARKYFGDANALGQTLEIDRTHPMQITAVLEDLPPGTHLDTEIIASGQAPFSAIAPYDAGEGQGTDSSYTYLQLDPTASIETLRAALPAFVQQHLQAAQPDGVKIALDPVAISDVHLTQFTQKAMRPGGNRATLNAVALAGLLVLVVASINFVNLMTARAGRRAVEVGVRKSVGASRGDLTIQFIGESLLYAAFAMLVAILIVESVLPAFNSFLDYHITFPYWRDPALSLSIIALTLLLGVLAGSYPALVLSSFSPVTALKSGAIASEGSGHVRQALVIIQFAILVGLAISTITVYRQARYAMNEGLRMDTDQILLVTTRCNNALKDEIRALPGVQGAACSSPHALNFQEMNMPFELRDGRRVWITGASVDFGFFELFGIQPVAGRVFSISRSDDALPPDFFAPRPAESGPASTVTVRIVLNETAALRAGFASPQAAVGQTISGFGGRTCEIIGVVPDLAVDTIHRAIAPVLYAVFPPSQQYLNIKLRSREIPQTLAAIDQLWNRLGDPKPIEKLFLDEHVQMLYLDVTRRGSLFAAFAGIAILVACMGLFALSAFMAEKRTKEIGIRRAMGAEKADIIRLLVWQFTKPVLWANLIAWPVAALAMNHWLAGFAYHVPLELAVFLGSGAAVLLIALLTVSVHTVLVARASPATALRYE